LALPGIFILDFFFMAFIIRLASIVGAVVIISGGCGTGGAGLDGA
jgi:hypothetical protein